jgi:hypothetical protein
MILISVLLAASVLFNAFQLYLAKINKKKPKPDLTASDLLHDLTSRGRAVVRVEVIDSTNLFLRSPRG